MLDDGNFLIMDARFAASCTLVVSKRMFSSRVAMTRTLYTMQGAITRLI